LPIPIPVPDKRDKPDPPAPRPPPKPTKPAAAKVDEPKPAPPPPPVDNPPPKTVEPPDPAFKVAVSELIHGKTCPDRKKAIAKLVALGDPRAIVNLTAARSRPYGGVLGMGQKNANGCLVADANAAIKKLTPPAPGK
ncbi:MAG: hypothetical protein NT062_04440, partial [Proteobacteria bacterium]|nr:hypothetical protein [Pseudomonadota bacterium]